MKQKVVKVANQHRQRYSFGIQGSLCCQAWKAYNSPCFCAPQATNELVLNSKKNESQLNAIYVN